MSSPLEAPNLSKEKKELLQYLESLTADLAYWEERKNGDSLEEKIKEFLLDYPDWKGTDQHRYSLLSRQLGDQDLKDAQRGIIGRLVKKTGEGKILAMANPGQVHNPGYDILTHQYNLNAYLEEIKRKKEGGIDREIEAIRKEIEEVKSQLK